MRGIKETRAISLFDKKFGKDIFSRARKIQEEHKEFQEALKAYAANPTKENLEHIKDEFSDLYATVSHGASILELYHNELLDMAIDKVTTRETNPDYKRFK
jgi:NTP pyrophosphatase (non-canonical NTP hydrolase)